MPQIGAKCLNTKKKLGKLSKIFKLSKITYIVPWHCEFEVNMVKKAKRRPPWTHSNLRPSRCAAGKKTGKENFVY